MAVERHRSGLLTAGAVLIIIAGGLGLIEGIRGVLLSTTWSMVGMRWVVWSHLPDVSGWMLAGGIVSLVLGVIAIIGGINALGMRNWGWALAGAICGLFAAFIPGLLGLIFIIASRKEFT
jgi:hypothetical protein